MIGAMLQIAVCVYVAIGSSTLFSGELNSTAHVYSTYTVNGDSTPPLAQSYVVMLGSMYAAFMYSGYDSVAVMSDDTINVSVSAPRYKKWIVYVCIHNQVD